MNDKIKEILIKHGVYNADTNNCINNAIIEICELQKEQCAEQSDSIFVILHENVAE